MDFASKLDMMDDDYIEWFYEWEYKVWLEDMKEDYLWEIKQWSILTPMEF